MDKFRMVFGIIFLLAVAVLVEEWVREDKMKAAAGGPAGVVSQNQSLPPVPGAAATGASVSSQPPVPAGTPAATSPAPAAGLGRGQRIRVQTDFLIAEIDTAGGDLRRLELTKARDPVHRDQNYLLLQDADERLFVAQSGLLGTNLPNHTTSYQASAQSYALASGQDTLTVPLEATVGGVKVVKTLTFHRGSYVIDVAFLVTNQGGAVTEPYAYFQLVRDGKLGSGESKMVPTYTGAEVFTEKDKLSKVAFGDVDKDKASFPKTATDGWVAMVQHYFVGAWVPRAGSQREYFVRSVGKEVYATGVVVSVGKLAPAASAAVSATLYAGPQEQEALKALAPGLELTVDYGWLRPMAVPIFWVMRAIHDLVKNWGVAIILLTVLLKLLFYPLSAASYKSMARMKVLGPKLEKLKERYGDDRAKLNQAMMELYKTEKINPLGGCLPILVQIPVFISLYWVLLLSVELRQAPFFGWIQDLSASDPYYILPIIMGATMFLQTSLNPTPPDPVQAKVMKIMPVAFSVFFFFFPAGLVLYWIVNNVLSIAQQWRINTVLERQKAAHGA